MKIFRQNIMFVYNCEKYVRGK